MKSFTLTRKKKAKRGRFVAIDFETANHSRDSACSIGIAIAEGRRIVALERRLIRPPTDEFRFTHIHGLTWSEVRNEPSFAAVWKDLHPVVADADFIAAHNASFDESVLRACCANHRIRLPKQPFVCTVKVARSVFDIYPTKRSWSARRHPPRSMKVRRCGRRGERRLTL